MTSIQPYRFKTIIEYHRVMGLPKPEHPLVSLINMDSVTPPVTEGTFSLIFDFYSISLKRVYNARFKYGQQASDFDKGMLFFMAPGQLLGVELEKGITHRPEGWMMLLQQVFILHTVICCKTPCIEENVFYIMHYLSKNGKYRTDTFNSCNKSITCKR